MPQAATPIKGLIDCSSSSSFEVLGHSYFSSTIYLHGASELLERCIIKIMGVHDPAALGRIHESRVMDVNTDGTLHEGIIYCEIPVAN